MATDENLEPFECLCCGRCCTIRGFVRISQSDIAEIVRFFGIPVAEVHERYAVRATVNGRKAVILRDHPGTTRCIFLDAQDLCQIHAAKPEQCRLFPVEWKDPSSHLYCAGLQRLHEAQA